MILLPCLVVHDQSDCNARNIIPTIIIKSVQLYSEEAPLVEITDIILWCMLIAIATFDVLQVLYAHNTNQTVLIKEDFHGFTVLTKVCTKLDLVCNM